MEKLHAFRLTPQNLPALAAFMARARPQWWDEAGAAGQLSGTELTIGTVGWLLGRDEAHPAGWLLCRELFLYRCLEVECCGFFEQGRFFLEHRLGALFDEAERYARAKGCTALRTAMGSEGFSIHGRPLGEIGRELQALAAPGRKDFHWLLAQGFRPAGIQPHALAAIFTACFSQKSSDAPQHKAARGARQLRVPRAALLSLFLESAPARPALRAKNYFFPPQPSGAFLCLENQGAPFSSQLFRHASICRCLSG